MGTIKDTVSKDIQAQKAVGIIEKSEYDQALSQYNLNITDEEVKAAVTKIIAEKVSENDNLEVKKFLLGSVELTTLSTTDTEEKVLEMVEKVNRFDSEYPDLPHVAALCAYPCFTKLMADSLEVDGVDIVMPVGKFLSGDYEGVCDTINELKQVCGDIPMKVILETGDLGNASAIKTASLLSMYAGADYIKTSTGKEKISATPESVYVMCQAIKEYYEKTGIQIGLKPAGGINTVMDAVIYYTIVKEVLGEKWLTNYWFRMGTSRLTNLLLSEIIGTETNFF